MIFQNMSIGNTGRLNHRVIGAVLKPKMRLVTGSSPASPASSQYTNTTLTPKG